jgi:hypothetical protein
MAAVFSHVIYASHLPLWPQRPLLPERVKSSRAGRPTITAEVPQEADEIAARAGR